VRSLWAPPGPRTKPDGHFTTFNFIKNLSLKKKLIIVFLIFVGVISYGIYWAFYDINRLPEGRFLTESKSPDSTYSIRAYVSESSLSADAIRGELNYLKTSRKPATIYWGYPESEAQIKWTDNNTVNINGKTLNVLTEKYDWRHAN